nr:MAG TPA: RecF/RecN/SMC N terminal domain [Bacteriophage sp.]
MAGLFFYIRADYDELIRAREEVVRVRKEIEKLNTTSSPELIHSLERDLAKSTKKFDELATAAVKTGAELENNFKQKIYQSSTAVNVLTEKIINQRAVVRDVDADVKRLSLSYANLGKFNTNSDQVLSELIASKKALDEEKATLFGLQQEQAKAKLSVKNLKDEYSSFKQTSGDVVISNGKLFDAIQSIPGPVGQAASSIKGLTKASLAFIATPLGAILATISVALMTVTSWFRRTEEGQNALNVASAYFKQTLNSILDVVDDVGEWLWKAFTKPKEALKDLVDFLEGQVMNRMKAFGKMGEAIWKIFSGDFSNGFADLGNAVAQGIYGIEDAGKKYVNFLQDMNVKAKKAMDIAERQNILDVKKREFLEERAKLEAKINELREKAYNPNNADEERLAAIKEVIRLTDELYNKEIALATEERDIIRETNKLSHSNKGEKGEEAQANAELSKLEAQRATAQRILLEQVKMLTNAGKQRLKLHQELSRSILESELKLQASRISAMEDGKAKRLALAQQETKDTIAAIQKEKEEYQRKVKESKGKADPAVIKTFDDRETVAKAKEQADIAKIEKEYAEEYKQRTKALTDVFLNEEERKLSSIKDRYDKERKWANEQLKTGGMTTEQHKSYTTDIDKAQQQETYRSLLDDLNDYKQKEKDLRDKWDTDIAVAVESKDAYLVAKLMKAKQKALSALNGQMLQESDEWQQLFGNLDNLTVQQLEKLSNTIKEKAKGLKLNPVDAQAVTNSLKEVDEKIRTMNPFGLLSKHLKEYKEAENDVTKKNALKEMFRDMAASIDMVKGGFDAVVGGLDEMGLAGDEVTQQLLSDLSSLMGSASQLATSIASANPVGIIQGGIGVLTSVFNIFNNDKRHEKKIKALQDQVDVLDKSYEKLGDSIEKAYSNDASNLIDQQNKLLEQQKVLIQQQIREEQDKKKTDKDRIKEWQDQIDAIDEAITDNKEKAVDAIFGEDLKSAIDNFANAYAEAWASGEDRAESAKDTVKKMMRQMVTESIKAAMESSGAMEKIRQKLKEFYADNVLSGWEQDYIYNMAEELQRELDRQFGWADSLMKDETEEDVDDTSDNSLKGAYAKASQESINLLAGQTGAVRVLLEDIRGSMQPIREQMRLIYDMQSRGWEDVKAIRELSDKVEKNTEQIADNTKEIKSVADKIDQNTRNTVDALEGTINVKVKM